MAPINEDDLEWTTISNGSMAVRRKQLGHAGGGEHLGCSLYELPPGEESWPYHYHTANEEALYVLAGTGTLRLAEDEYGLEAGEYVAFPADESGAHRVVNDGQQTLRYLVVSTMNEPDVTVYPDSEKLGVFVGSPPGGRDERTHQGFYHIEDDVEYLNGE